LSDRFDILETSLSGLKIIQRKIIGDSRGYLERLFCSAELKTVIPGKNISQINHTLTVRRGAVRGMHFQHPPHAETKFVSCVRGEVFDVAVDIRFNSPTFLQWHAEILSDENHKALVIPEGFAHGFQTLTKDCEMLYFHTVAYRAESEGGVNAIDPRLAIQWPLEISERSPRDSEYPAIPQNFKGIAL